MALCTHGDEGFVTLDHTPFLPTRDLNSVAHTSAKCSCDINI